MLVDILAIAFGIILLLVGISSGIIWISEAKRTSRRLAVARIEMLEKELFPDWFRYAYRYDTGEICYYATNPPNMRGELIAGPKPLYDDLTIPVKNGEFLWPS